MANHVNKRPHMKIVQDSITIDELKEMSEKMFSRLVKAVVDVELNVMAVDAEMHADQEELLLEKGSKQTNLWGINLHPHKSDDEFIEFDSMINLRPSQGNRTRSVDDPNLQKKIIGIVNTLVKG